MFKNLNKMKKIIIILFVLVGLTSCNHEQENTGWDYMGKFDMYYSKAYESYSPNKNFKDGKTLQKPVEGTISREFMPYPFKDKFGDKTKAGELLKNPFQPTKENLERGKMKYDIYCAICHGEKGKGDGKLTKLVKNKKKLYSGLPADLTAGYIHAKPDGEIFHVITMGSAVMGAHASQIKSDDRWKIVLYIKNNLK
jgi:mono/diheme cytochrome c family protein